MSQNIKQHKIWTAEDDQLLIDTFNRYQYDVKVAKFTRKQLGRGDTAVRARLSRLIISKLGTEQKLELIKSMLA